MGSGSVDKHVKPLEAAEHHSDELGACPGGREVGAEGFGGTAGAGNLRAGLRQGVEPASRYGHDRTLGGKPNRNGAADAAAAAGDESDATIQPEPHALNSPLTVQAQ